ncbi:SulP family inorganic anion transporter [Betaproteobacteria bacterium PRO5]|nr:SulP family inorganic anion transporter [Betaproteobacteria bacterium PRO5]
MMKLGTLQNHMILRDLYASIVVFFVALPLCLGIAMASGAPLFSGIIAGIVGGIIVGMASGSQLGVSGPAAGLAVIVLNAIATLGSWEAFLLSVMLAGVLQIGMGYLRLGTIAYYFPVSVIKGMLSGIGLVIILKQIPHALGYDRDFEGDLAFFSPEGESTLGYLVDTLYDVSPAAILVTVISMSILLLWEMVLYKKYRIFQILQGPLVVVAIGILLSYLFDEYIESLNFETDDLVNLPVALSIQDFAGQFTFPDFSHLANPEIYFIALVIAVIASLETLLCVEATDKLDPLKRVTSTNRELVAQGLGNTISGLIGGLPVTQVIVRSSANITFGGRTKLSTIFHGVLLLICVIVIPGVLNMIPLASLACILFVVGYNLAKPSLFKAMYELGWSQFAPFIATVIGILLTDLLKGIGIGMVVAIFFILRSNLKTDYELFHEKNDGVRKIRLVLAEDVSFLNKGSIGKALKEFESDSWVIIDGSKSKYIDHDIIEIIRDFTVNAHIRDINVEVIGIPTLETKSRYQRIMETRYGRPDSSAVKV